MSVLLAIPSFNRPYNLQNTIMYWLKDYTLDWKVFVEPRQYMYYKQIVKPDNLIRTHNENYICGQMQDICEYAQYHNYKYVFKVDDDMCFTRRGSKKPDHGAIASELVLDCVKFMDENPDCGLLTAPKAMTYLYYKKEDLFVEINKPIYSNYFIRVQDLSEIMKREYLIFDDLLVSFATKARNKKIYRYMGAYESAKTHKNEGGLQSFDREKLSKLSYKALKKDYPLLEGIDAKNTKNNCFDVSSDRYFQGKFE